MITIKDLSMFRDKVQQLLNLSSYWFILKENAKKYNRLSSVSEDAAEILTRRNFNDICWRFKM